MREGVARRLDPLADVGVPEDLDGEAVAVARDSERGRRLRQLERFEDADFRKLGVLAWNGARQHVSRRSRQKGLVSFTCANGTGE